MKPASLILASLLATGGVTLQAHSEEAHWYAEGGYHIVTVDTSGVDVTVGMLAVNGGYEFANGFALEGIVGQGVLDDTITVLATDVDVGLGTSYGIAAKYSFDVGEKVRLHGKIRYSSFEVEAKAAGMTLSETDEEFGFGIGGTYSLSDRAYAILEYNRFAEDSNAYFIGVGFTF